MTLTDPPKLDLDTHFRAIISEERAKPGMAHGIAWAISALRRVHNEAIDSCFQLARDTARDFRRKSEAERGHGMSGVMRYNARAMSLIHFAFKVRALFVDEDPTPPKATAAPVNLFSATAKATAPATTAEFGFGLAEQLLEIEKTLQWYILWAQRDGARTDDSPIYSLPHNPSIGTYANWCKVLQEAAKHIPAIPAINLKT